jgi:hypothetical protein
VTSLPDRRDFVAGGIKSSSRSPLVSEDYTNNVCTCTELLLKGKVAHAMLTGRRLL